jgi:hypothetical protein
MSYVDLLTSTSHRSQKRGIYGPGFMLRDLKAAEPFAPGFIPPWRAWVSISSNVPPQEGTATTPFQP